MKFKIFFSVLILTVLIFSCKDDDEDDTPFDHVAQALTDDTFIKEYLETHYYTEPISLDEPFGVIDSLDVAAITLGETPLIDLVTTQQVNYKDVDYKLYFLKNTQANPHPESSFARVDSVMVKYQGLHMDYHITTKKFDERVIYKWFMLTSVVPGWSYGFPNFDAGNQVIIPNEAITYENTGKGMLFIPSGLAYRELGSGAIGGNKNIMFHIELAQTEEADFDNDGISTIYEDLDGDDDYSNDDTDADNLPNYADLDDENDGLATRYESADPNEDNNPSDALDTDNDGIPNYLDDDDDGDGILTINENADPNRNGKPEDAVDTDGDNIPDYLDAN